MKNLDPFSLSRRLEKSAGRYQGFLRSLPHQPAMTSPFGGDEFPGKRHLEFVQDLPDGDPLRSQLTRWVVHLVEARIHVPWRAHESDLEYRTLHPVKDPEEGKFSFADMRQRMLAGTRGAPRQWRANAARFEKSLHDHRAQLAMRQTEVAMRLGLDDALVFWEPVVGEGGSSALARQLLRDSGSDADSLWGWGFGALVEAALARNATEGWPGRLTPDSLRDILGERELYRGLSLRPDSLPARHCPMSFPRAARELGRALGFALRPLDVPFVVSADPHDLRGRTLGALFALWTLSPKFQLTKLRLNRAQVDVSMRAFGPALLAHLRLSAARVLVFEAASRGPKNLKEEFPQLADELCREELPPSAALVRFRAISESRAEFAGLLSAFVWENELREEHDEDWYLNPRAQTQIREELRRPSPVTVPAERLEQGLKLALSRNHS